MNRGDLMSLGVSDPRGLADSSPGLGVRAKVWTILFVLALAPAALAQDRPRSLAESELEWPSLADVIRVITLQDYNTRVVALGTMMLGLAAGIIGPFMLLRRRALVGDALSHAMTPGIGIAFMVMVLAGGTGKSLIGLLIGAVIAGLLGIGTIMLIRKFTRLKEDAALGIVLSVFFGLGVALFRLAESLPQGHAAGLDSYIYGKTASMLASDSWLILGAAVLTAVVCVALFKEFALLSFDQGFAEALGFRTALLDTIMMGLVVLVTVIGLQAVGLILMVALLVIPAAAARFWTHRLPTLVLMSAILGAVSAFVGACLSSLFENLPAGAVIVCVSGAAFVVSLFIGPARGVVGRVLRHRRLVRRVGRQNLLRAMLEGLEGGNGGVTLEQLRAARSWSAWELRLLLASATRDGLVRRGSDGAYYLTEDGLADARRVVRNHRLWEMFLITHADVAASHVDRDADRIEHVLGRDMIEELEALIARGGPEPMPASPHALREGGR